MCCYDIKRKLYFKVFFFTSFFFDLTKLFVSLVNVCTFVFVAKFPAVCDWSHHCTLYMHLKNTFLIGGFFGYDSSTINTAIVSAYDKASIACQWYPMASFVIWTKNYRYVESVNWDILVYVRPCNSFLLYPHVKTVGSFHYFDFPDMLTAFSRGLNFMTDNLRDILHELYFVENTKFYKIRTKQSVQKLMHLSSAKIINNDIIY